MSRLLPIFLLLLAACAPAVTPQRSESQTALPASTAPATSTSVPTQTAALQPTVEAAAAPTPTTAAAGALWLRILTPQDGDTVSAPDLQIKGEAPAETTVTINDQILVVSAKQSFETTIRLEAGPNLIEIVASDLNGNEIFIPLTIEYEP